jgi:hypothetical protein
VLVGVPLTAMLSACGATQAIQEAQGPALEVQPATQTLAKVELERPEKSP